MTVIVIVYVLYMTACYGFIVADQTPALMRAISYSSIAATFLFAAVIFSMALVKKAKHEGGGRDESGDQSGRRVLLEAPAVSEALFLLLALAFTLAADFFLVCLDDFFEVAVALFLGAQLCHFVRLVRVPGAAKKRMKRFLISLGIRLMLTGVTVFVITQVLRLTGLLEILAAVYFPELVMNAADAFIRSGDAKRMILSGIGFVLFIGCDVCVGLSGMGDAWRISAESLGTIRYLIWIFYLPSQALIVLSGLKCGPRRAQKEIV